MSIKNMSEEKSKPTVLLVTSSVREVDEKQWARVQSRFNILLYDCESVQQFRERLEPGKVYSKINAIVRTGWLKAEPFSNHFLFTRDLIPHYPPSLKLIICSGHGYDSADLDLLTERGIWYCNTPDTCTEAVANTALYLILDTFRYFTFAQQAARTDWLSSRALGMKASEPEGKILGIVGMGSIGRAIAKKAIGGLGMKVHYFNRRQDVKGEATLEGGATYHQSLESLINISDCLCLCCPYTKSNHHMLSTKEFSMAKSSGLRIVNIARGQLIDEAALLSAIQSQQIIGVGLDVHENEPGINPAWTDNYMATVLPHIGVCSRETWRKFDTGCLDNLEEYFYGSKSQPLTPVNIVDT